MSEILHITKEQFLHALTTPGVVHEGDLELLRVMCAFESCEATATQLCDALGKKAVIVVNGIYGKMGKRIGECIGVKNNGGFNYWRVLSTGEYEGSKFVWTLRKQLVEALRELGHLDGDELPFPSEISDDKELFEGAKCRVLVNAYERNIAARRICIQHHGLQCFVCGFDFKKAYGELGDGFIHVHHIRELSEIGAEYKVNPMEDLRPVCPNCHAMLHRRKPAFTIEELQKRLHK